MEEKNVERKIIEFNIFDNAKTIDKQIKQLIVYQTELFKTFDSKRKKELKQKIEDIQLGLIQTSIRDIQKINNIKYLISKNKKPWFIWNLEFYDVFKSNGGFDIVIGNPPYVDSEHMHKTLEGFELRQTCSRKYKTAKGNWDLFIVFVELGFRLLSSKGILSLIIPNNQLLLIPERISLMD